MNSKENRLIGELRRKRSISIGEDGGIAEYDIRRRGKGLLGADISSWHMYVVRGICGQGRIWKEDLMGGKCFIGILARADCS
jgi:hypothetical protein